MNILITGCSTGIGLESAKTLKNRGYRVFATARKKEDVEKLTELGFESFWLDVTIYESIDACFEEILKLTNNKLDVVFNNGAYGQPGAVEDLSVDTLKEQFETNVFGWHYLTCKAVDVMRQQGGYGKIIQHSSVLGLISLKFRGAYNASKYALEGLNDTLRQELSNTNIKVITVNTGPVTSNFRKNALEKFKENIDIENSAFSAVYKKQLKERLESDKDDTPFNLTSKQASEVILKIVKAKNPKPRYFITKATYILYFFKRILSTSVLDKLLNRI
jgi:short-subunit dehydrogenase